MSTSLSRRSPTAHPTRQQLDELDALLKRMLDLPVHRLDDELEGGDAPPTEPARGSHRASAAQEAAVNYQTPEEDEADLKPRVVFAGTAVAEMDHPASDAPAAHPQTAAAQQSDKEDWVPLTSTWKPSTRTWKPLSEAWRQAQTAGRPPVAPPAAREEFVDPAPPPSPEMAPMPDETPRMETPQQAAPAESAPTVVVASPLVTEVQAFPVVAPPASDTPWFLWPLVLFNAGFDAFLLPWGAPGRWLRGPAGRWLLAVLGVLCLGCAAALIVADWFGWTW